MDNTDKPAKPQAPIKENKVNSLSNAISEVCTQAGVVLHNIIPNPAPIRPPWTLLAASIHEDIPNVNKKENPHLQKTPYNWIFRTEFPQRPLSLYRLIH